MQVYDEEFYSNGQQIFYCNFESGDNTFSDLERLGANTANINRYIETMNLISKEYWWSTVCKMWDMEPVDAIIKIALETTAVEATGFQCCYEDKKNFFLSDYCAVGSDATSTLASRFTKQPNQPRAFGCFPRFIQTYVKENAVFTFEEAVRKMTSLPADIMKIKDRGLIKEGMKADLVIMDYDNIKDNATYLDSNHYPSGIDTVIVNGKVAISEGVHQKILSGVALKYNGK